MQRAGAPRADRSARPLGLPRSLAANLNPGPQFCSLDPRWRGPTWPQLAARSSQLGVGTQHTATRARSLPRSPQFCSSSSRSSSRRKKQQAPVPREELSEATRASQHHSIPTYHQGRVLHPSISRTGRQGTRVDIPIRPLASYKADEADTSGQPVSTAHTAQQSTISRDLVLGPHPGFGFWLFKVGFAFDFDCRPRSSPVVCSGRLETASSPAVTTPLLLLIARALALRAHNHTQQDGVRLSIAQSMRHIRWSFGCICLRFQRTHIHTYLRPPACSASPVSLPTRQLFCQPLLAATTRSVDSR